MKKRNFSHTKTRTSTLTCHVQFNIICNIPSTSSHVTILCKSLNITEQNGLLYKSARKHDYAEDGRNRKDDGIRRNRRQHEGKREMYERECFETNHHHIFCQIYSQTEIMIPPTNSKPSAVKLKVQE